MSTDERWPDGTLKITGGHTTGWVSQKDLEAYELNNRPLTVHPFVVPGQAEINIEVRAVMRYEP